MKKRLLALTLGICLLAGSLAGCGKTEDSEKQKGGAELTGEKITITAQLHGYGQEWLENAAEEFTYQTGIEVECTFDALLSSNLTTILETKGVEKSDIYYAGSYEWSKWLTSGLIEDLTEFMSEPDENEGGKSINERITTSIKYLIDDEGNKAQGIFPFSGSVQGVAYNKEIMSYIAHDLLGWEEGHEYPINTKELFEVVDALNTAVEQGKNKELLTYSQDGKQFNVKALTWSGSVGTMELFFYPWFGQYVGQEQLSAYLADEDDNPDMYDCEAMFYVYQLICDLMDITKDETGNVYSANSIPNCVSYNHTASQSQFLLGKSLMIPTGDWFYTEMEASIEDDSAWGFMPVPWMSDEDGNPITAEGVEMPKDADGNYKPYDYSSSSGAFMVIPSEARNKENAKKFLRFMVSSEYLPRLEEDMQSCLCFEVDHTKVEKTAWFEEVLKVQDKVVKADYFSPHKMVLYGQMSFYKNPGTTPYTSLATGRFGSVEKMVDSATGKTLNSGDTPTGVAVTENVYKYVIGNAESAKRVWDEAKALVGVR